MPELTNESGERGLPATVTYLELKARPSPPGPPRPAIKSAILRAENPSVHFYRYLYNTIGHDYFWVERRKWGDKVLAALLASPQVELYVLYVSGAPAGMAELDFRDEKAAQVAYFGLMPDFVGRKLGPWFLYQTPANGVSAVVTVQARLQGDPDVFADAKVSQLNYDWPGV